VAGQKRSLQLYCLERRLQLAHHTSEAATAAIATVLKRDILGPSLSHDLRLRGRRRLSSGYTRRSPGRRHRGVSVQMPQHPCVRDMPHVDPAFSGAPQRNPNSPPSR
jgi:hypothetical protein